MADDKIYTLSDFYFDLPDELIAQYPEQNREESRLFIMDRKTDRFEHRLFYQITDMLVAGDVMIFNDARVIPARMLFKRATGGITELVLVRTLGAKKWLVICNRTKRIKTGEILRSTADSSVRAEIVSRVEDYLEVEFNVELDDALLQRIGMVPLPPYIRREYTDIDAERYQTVYAGKSGAAAAPTAGLHFTNELMSRISDIGVQKAFVTLHVSWGTFQPVRHEDLSSHRMHSEKFDLPEDTAIMINRARRERRRVIAVGTTSLRVLESTFHDGRNRAGEGETDIFIYPPKKIQSIDALITNFHTPYSTLLMLVASFAGYDLTMNAYRTAVDSRYRFFSYGDAMMIT